MSIGSVGGVLSQAQTVFNSASTGQTTANVAQKARKKLLNPQLLPNKKQIRR